MSLFKQLYLLLFSALFLTFCLSYWLVLQSSRDFLQKQLYVSAQHTATSSGVSLGKFIAEEDKAQIEKLLKIIFDKGDYAEISVEDTKRNILGRIRAKPNKNINNVPEWFESVIALSLQKVVAKISFGSQQVGTIAVITYPGSAYEQLWQIARRNFWALMGMLLLYLVIVSIINNKIARPIAAVIAQAKALTRKKYQKITELPDIPELKLLVHSMNTMVDSTERQIKKLTKDARLWHQKAFIDPLTTLPNRSDFQRHVQEITQKEADYYSISVGLIKISGLSGINLGSGYRAGDNLLKLIGIKLSQLQQQEAGTFIARLNGAEFVVVMRDFTVTEIKPFYESISRNINRLLAKHDGECKTFIGAVVMQPGQSIEKYLAAADNQLVDAMEEAVPVKIALKEDQIMALGKEKQLQSLWNAIKNNSIRLKSQVVVNMQDEQLVAREFFLQVQVDVNTWIPAGRWLSRLKNHREMAEVDKIVITKIFENPQQDTVQMVNVSPRSFSEENGIVPWLIEKYQSQIAATPLAVEFSQLLVSQPLLMLEKWIATLKRAEIQVGVDHFGFQADSIQWLTQLKPDYIKLNSSILSTLDNSKENLPYIETLINLAHTLEIKVYATGIETEQILTLAMQLDFDGYQGFAIEKPGFVVSPVET